MADCDCRPAFLRRSPRTPPFAEDSSSEGSWLCSPPELQPPDSPPEADGGDSDESDARPLTIRIIRASRVREEPPHSGRPLAARLAVYRGGALPLVCLVVVAVVLSALAAESRFFSVTEITSLELAYDGDTNLSANEVSLCSRTEEDVEYHTKHSLHVVNGSVSKAMCCAQCSGDPECGAWTWGQRRGVEGLTNHCFLKWLGAGERPVRVKRTGVVSGMVEHRVLKHGAVASLLSMASDATFGRQASPVARNATCRGSLQVAGYGSLSVVNALWEEPQSAAAAVDVLWQGRCLAPHYGSRGYLAQSCHGGSFHPGSYAPLRLLGMKLQYVVDLSGVGCGCSVQLRLVPMHQRENPSKCQDYYCSPGGKDACGETCAHIGLQDANQYAWATSLHLSDDPMGVSAGYGGGETSGGNRDWDDADYGPGARCVDTTWPFKVEISFPVDMRGELESVEVRLSQQGKPCSVSARIGKYNFRKQLGLRELSRLMDEGLTPVVSYSGSTSAMRWFDGVGSDGRGPCVKDTPSACPRSARLYDFTLDWSLAKAGSESSSPLDIAALEVHSRQELRALSLRRQRLAEAQAMELQGTKEECGENCEPLGEAMLNLTVLNFSREDPAGGGEEGRHLGLRAAERAAGKGGGGSGLYEEVSSHNREWEVMVDMTPVLGLERSKTVRYKRRGDTVVGQKRHGRLRLEHERGELPLSALRERVVSYRKVVNGSCAAAGMEPIMTDTVCQAAAFSMGYFDTFLNFYSGAGRRPQGCYLWEGQLFVATNAASFGVGSVGDRTPLCSSVAYATTTVTTSTTLTTTATTVTSTRTTLTTVTQTSTRTTAAPPSTKPTPAAPREGPAKPAHPWHRR